MKGHIQCNRQMVQSTNGIGEVFVELNHQTAKLVSSQDQNYRKTQLAILYTPSISLHQFVMPLFPVLGFVRFFSYVYAFVVYQLLQNI